MVHPLNRLPNPMHFSSSRTAILLAALGMFACRAASPCENSTSKANVGPATTAVIPPPMTLGGKAYEAAGARELPKVAAEERGGLHNVFHLSENIISGSEPHGAEALAALAEMGVKTIISVDGKTPEAETAEAFGIRYVHIPVQYKGIDDAQLAQLAKTYRELEGPFYVHCFHGKHRGPAAAAVGRIVLDGTPREQAIAEMRQYCGTSSKYEGLYRVIAAGAIPDAADTRTFRYGFESKHRPEGIVGSMVPLARSHDNIEILIGNAWASDPEHPDVDAQNEVEKLHSAFVAASELAEVKDAPQDLAAWMAASLEESRTLVTEVALLRSGDRTAADRAAKSFAAIQKLCSDCHGVYRN